MRRLGLLKEYPLLHSSNVREQIKKGNRFLRSMEAEDVQWNRKG